MLRQWGDAFKQQNIYLGTCTWNYDSWVGLVYSEEKRYAADYLSEYSRYFDTAEIDSWFYHMPSGREAEEYRRSAPGLRFTCKVPQMITLTHHRSKNRKTPLEKNEDFLSVELFKNFLEQIDPLIDRMDAVMLEFEYLNKQKMSSLEEFLTSLDNFVSRIPKEVPLALEPRNSNYMKKPYFEFIREHGLIHVFSEKIYMPHIYDLYPQIEAYLTGSTVIRLLGGDRRKIEGMTKQKWNSIVMPQPDIEEVASMIRDLSGFLKVTVNVNNHYEGSSPLTADRIRQLLLE